MADNQVKIIITTDASGAVTGVKQATQQLTELGEKGAAGVAKANREMRLFNQIGQVVQSQFGFLTIAAKGFIAALTIQKAVEFGEEYAKTAARIRATFGETSVQVTEQLRAMSEKINHYFSFTELGQAAARVNDLFDNLDLSGGQIMSTIARAADIAKAKGMDLEETLSRIAMGTSGMARGVKQFGVIITDSYMQNEAWNGSLKDSWKYMDENEKAQLRLAQIMEQTNKYQDAATKGAGTFGGAMKSLWHTLEDEFGPALQVVNQKLATTINLLNQTIKRKADFRSDFGEYGFDMPEDQSELSPGGIRRPMPEAPTTEELLKSANLKAANRAADAIRHATRTAQQIFKEETDELKRLVDAGAGAEGFGQAWMNYYDKLMKSFKEAKGGGKGPSVTSAAEIFQSRADQITEQNVTALEQYNAQLEELNRLRTDINPLTKEAYLSEETYNRAVLQSWDALVKAAQATEEYKDQMARETEFAKDWDESRTALEQYENEMVRLNNMLEEFGANYEEVYNRLAEKAKEAFDKASDSSNEFFIQAARNIQTALGDQLYDVMTGKFDNIGTAFSQLLMKMAANAAAAQIGTYLFGDFGKTNKIGGALGGLGDWFLKLFTNMGGGGGGGGINNITLDGGMIWGGAASGGVFSLLGKPIPAYAYGGITSGPSLMWVGEGRNREAIVPLPDGKSIPVMMTGGPGQSKSDKDNSQAPIYFVIRSNDPETTVRPFMPSRSQARAKIMSVVMRGQRDA